jgi:hypothetical protein
MRAREVTRRVRIAADAANFPLVGNPGDYHHAPSVNLADHERTVQWRRKWHAPSDSLWAHPKVCAYVQRLAL